MSRWVSVNERLPDNSLKIIVSGLQYDHCDNKKNMVTMTRYYETGGFNTVGFGRFDITHWQPLPEAPKDNV